MNRRTVLLAEDDLNVRAFVSEALGIDGFDILQAEDGTRALSLAETTPRSIELLVTDVQMPGIDGLELARRVRMLRPDTGVLYISSAPADEVLARGLPDIGSTCLAKPFGLDVLLEAVRNTLSGTANGRAAGRTPAGTMGDHG
jgi:DNA-binding response OmpR family regulator